MDNIQIITNEQGQEYVVIDRGNNEYTSMPKSVYDEMQKAELNGNN